MTALATLFTRDMIVMAADSLEVELDDYESRKVQGTRETQKLFLSQKCGTGVSVSGYASWEGKSIRDILEDFLQAMGEHHSQEGVAHGLCAFLEERYPRLRSRFHVCGFNDREPYVALVDYGRDGEESRHVRRMNLDGQGRLHGGILTFCERETYRYARRHLPDLDILAAADAMDFMAMFFAHEMELVQRSKETADVGGPVDILVLRPDRQSFHAVKRIEDALLI